MKPDREDGVGITLGVQEGSRQHAFKIAKPEGGDVPTYKKKYTWYDTHASGGRHGGASAAPGT